ncbi:hypothetical protein ACQ86N_05945 [Puia sp. P3]|uniref:hypothetical protein n=1 Tax=Puia sp. P3 TaxID=3423952 RepID=UPI003D677B08
MSNVKEFSVEEKLTSLVTLQKIESKLDEYKILKGELPMEVSDLEDEIQVCTLVRLAWKRRSMGSRNSSIKRRKRSRKPIP